MPDAPKKLPRPGRPPGPARASTTARGYGWAHRQIRERLLRERPLCERCRAAWSAHLHHRDRNPFNRSEPNLELLCEGCHQAEHAGGPR